MITAVLVVASGVVVDVTEKLIPFVSKHGTKGIIWYTYIMQIILIIKTIKSFKIKKYRITGNIGGELNLADWRFWKQSTK